MRRGGPKLVFCGPSLPRADIPAARDLVALPPVAEGELVAAVNRYEPSAVLIIDGVFQTEPSIRHKEILWALSEGVTVMGAASMGALRAAELFPHMLGVGLIYRWYRRFSLAPDDAVAVLHGPAELGSPPLTEALIDMRRTLARAARAGGLPEATGRKLATTASALGFRDRTWLRVIMQGCPALTEEAVQSLRGRLAANAVHQKRNDALQALALLQQGGIAAPLPPPFVATRAFAPAMELVA